MYSFFFSQKIKEDESNRNEKLCREESVFVSFFDRTNSKKEKQIVEN